MHTINYLTVSLGHQDEVNTGCGQLLLRWHSVPGDGAGFDEQAGHSLMTELISAQWLTNKHHALGTTIDVVHTTNFMSDALCCNVTMVTA